MGHVNSHLAYPVMREYAAFLLLFYLLFVNGTAQVLLHQEPAVYDQGGVPAQEFTDLNAHPILMPAEQFILPYNTSCPRTAVELHIIEQRYIPDVSVEYVLQIYASTIVDDEDAPGELIQSHMFDEPTYRHTNATAHYQNVTFVFSGLDDIVAGKYWIGFYARMARDLDIAEKLENRMYWLPSSNADTHSTWFYFRDFHNVLLHNWITWTKTSTDLEAKLGMHGTGHQLAITISCATDFDWNTTADLITAGPSAGPREFSVGPIVVTMSIFGVVVCMLAVSYLYLRYRQTRTDVSFIDYIRAMPEEQRSLGLSARDLDDPADGFTMLDNTFVSNFAEGTQDDNLWIADMEDMQL